MVVQYKRARSAELEDRVVGGKKDSGEKAGFILLERGSSLVQILTIYGHM